MNDFSVLECLSMTRPRGDWRPVVFHIDINVNGLTAVEAAVESINGVLAAL